MFTGVCFFECHTKLRWALAKIYSSYMRESFKTLGWRIDPWKIMFRLGREKGVKTEYLRGKRKRKKYSQEERL